MDRFSEFVEDVILGLKVASSVGLELFAIEESVKTPGKTEKENFYSRVVNLLYIAKQTRSDIPLAVNFL